MKGRRMREIDPLRTAHTHDEARAAIGNPDHVMLPNQLNNTACSIWCFEEDLHDLERQLQALTVLASADKATVRQVTAFLAARR